MEGANKRDASGEKVDALSRRHQLTIGTITLVCLCVMITSWAVQFWRRGRTIDVERHFVPVSVQLKIDINEAEWPELTLLPDISETMARRVVEYRELHGNFATLDEIKQVKGIGPRTLARIKPYLFPVAAVHATVED